MSGPVAAVDCGTNTTRLLITDGGRDVERRAVITRLGRGVDATGRLSPEGIEATVAVLREYGDLIRRHGVTAIRVAATSAARDASNRDEFFDGVETALGARPELLTGDEEARLAYDGATFDLDPGDGPFLVVDIGGGSTEFALADGAVSLETGSVRLTEQWLHSDPPTAEELSMAVSVVRTHLDDVTRLLPATKNPHTIVGVAGTVTTVAAIELGLVEYDRDRIHRFRLTRAAAEDVFRTLATERLDDRVHNPGLDPARADVIVGGCCVLVGVLRHFDADAMLVSETDSLDGLARSLV